MELLIGLVLVALAFAFLRFELHREKQKRVGALLDFLVVEINKSSSIAATYGNHQIGDFQKGRCEALRDVVQHLVRGE